MKLNGGDKNVLIRESFGALSDETILEIFEQLAPKERARFSTINKRLYSLLHPWSDINRITAHKVGIVLASDRCILEVHSTGDMTGKSQSDVNKLASALRSSPFIQKLVISSVDHIRTIPVTTFSYLSNLRELTLPCDIFDKESNLHDKIKAIFSIKKLIILRILKRFDTPRKATNIVHAEHTQKLQSDAIKMLKLQGVSLTAAAMETISNKYSNSLKYLCLMGALVHTPDGAVYLKALCNLKCLSKLTLPPSLLSLSSKPLYHECRMLQQLTVKYLCVCVYESEIIETRYFIKKLLPLTLRELCLHDPTHMVAKDLEHDEFRKLHFKVTFCKRADSLYQQEWMHGHCELLSHMVWVQPYKHFNTEYPHPVPGWWFFMSENVDTAEESTEITATEEFPVPQPQATAQVQLPPNEDPGEMMMATIARFFERMIDDQLNTEFDGSAPTNLAVLGNLSNNVVTPNTASQLALPSNEIDNHSERTTDRSRRSYVIISRRGRGNLNQSRRISSQASAQSIALTQPLPPTELHQEASVTAESPDSEDSEELSDRDSGNNETDHFGSTTSMMTATTNTTSTARPAERNTRRSGL
uniref:F-box domain-containing protein n=1 Tax=Onchocerca volvulus TaxID=6282 RepID=A0A8R1Y549_ONCVO